MTQKMDRSVSSEVKNRLEELFMEDGEHADDAVFESDIRPGDNGLRELKAVILAVDWEINDETMSGLLNQIEVLKKVYRKDRINLLFLQLLGNLGNYIKAKKANAHPDSIKLLGSAFDSFEKAVTDKQLSESDRKTLLQIEVGRFVELKEQVSSKKSARAGGLRAKETPAAFGAGRLSSPMPPEFAAVVEDLKAMIRAEFNDLKAELRMLIKNRP